MRTPHSNDESSKAALVKRHLIRDRHRIAFTVAGAADGVPVAVLHGGPGSGSQPSVRRLFDLARFRVVQIDQRGAGASRPHGSVRHNRTDRLIGDMEAIRRELGIERWGVLGGSWGASLALAYAGMHWRHVTGVVVRGLFLASRAEVRKLFVMSRKRAPREWARLSKAASTNRPASLLRRCEEALRTRGDPSRQRAVALAWQAYEEAVLASANSRRALRRTPRTRVGDRRSVGKYRIQAHYLMHDCWLGEHRLLSLARRAAQAGVPIAAIHGSRDPVCPIDNLRRLAGAIPQLQTTRVRAGHLGSEPALARGVAQAIETMFGSSSGSRSPHRAA
ncbi:prolyl aminopeptidase [Trinickia symbiotica]|uniref:Proline iminopeptidase n=1 Tax=Trinickia symbiotica TaxID=863227 RepID=A0A2N7X0U1_9BURK|nr:alpha/beta fold hydrolase [Trinickia symbiotica]PMS35349.1 prolyl aminopeptidase [Trinickia symbiotica]PPK45357.1 prolyl aminopeptidase [Trinickia symbiotica]